MAGIFDEVMDGINAKTTPASTMSGTTPIQPVTTETQTTPAVKKDNSMHNYSDKFNEKYGDRKKTT